MNNIWTWLIVGLIPYSIKKHQGKDGQTLEIQAWFWDAQVYLWHTGGYDWTLHIPLIKRLYDTAWAVVMWLKKN